MWRKMFLKFLLLTLLFLSACQPSPTVAPAQAAQPSSQVIIQGDIPNKEELQNIEINNCDGKGDLTRTESRSQSVEVTISAELAARIGASVEVISTDVQTTVGAAVTRGGVRGTSIQLLAPPKTKMVFQLVWIGKEQIGIVQNVRGSNIPVAFRGFTPTDVRIKSQQDIGCPGITGSQPVVAIQPTYTPFPTLTPYPAIAPPTAAPLPTQIPSIPTRSVIPDLVVSATASNGVAFTSPLDGTYRFTIKDGIYCTAPGLCRSIIRGYLGRDVAWKDWYGLPHPMDQDYELGCWEDKTAINRNCSVGMSTTISMKAKQYIRWIVMEDRNAYADNTGAVILAIEKLP